MVVALIQSESGDVIVEPLGRQYDRSAFDCGNEALNSYLKRQASQDVKRRISRVFVARSPADCKRILGYYTLSSLSIELSSLPEKMAKKLPKYPLPAALIGRLGVDTSIKAQGYGGLLLADAIKRTLAVSVEIAIYAIVVDSVDEHAESFYQHFGFQRLEQHSPRLFLPLKAF